MFYVFKSQPKAREMFQKKSKKARIINKLFCYSPRFALCGFSAKNCLLNDECFEFHLIVESFL